VSFKKSNKYAKHNDMSLKINELVYDIIASILSLLHTFGLFTTVSRTINSSFLGGDWSRPSGNTGMSMTVA
jgi:hypothetical protein